jgi:prepilin peptidase CpaA
MAGIVFGVLVLVLVAVAVIDVLTFRIPNGLTGALLAGFLVRFLMLGVPGSAVASAFAVGVVVLAAGFGCYARGWIGGGDAKLAATLTFGVGLAQIADFLLLTGLFGLVLTLLVLSLRHFAPTVFLPSRLQGLPLFDPSEGVPYGAALAGAALVVLAIG